jgi:hypothetical protein
MAAGSEACLDQMGVPPERSQRTEKALLPDRAAVRRLKMVRPIPTDEKAVVKHPKQRRRAGDGTRWQLRAQRAARLGEFSSELRQALRGLGDHQTSPTEQRRTMERTESSNRTNGLPGNRTTHGPTFGPLDTRLLSFGLHLFIIRNGKFSLAERIPHLSQTRADPRAQADVSAPEIRHAYEDVRSGKLNSPFRPYPGGVWRETVYGRRARRSLRGVLPRQINRTQTGCCWIMRANGRTSSS